MATFLTILILALFYAIYTRIVGILILNFVGLPGALLGFKSAKKDFRYILGVIISAIGHIYIHTAIMIYLIVWTDNRINHESFSRYVIWFFCIAAAVGSIQHLYYQAKKEDKEFPIEYLNPQIMSLLVTEVVSFFGFFVILFYPGIIHPLWSWVLKIGLLFG